jgi:hypothetical protein
MTSNQYGPYGQGCTRATMHGTEGRKTARWSKSQKTMPSSDWRLQLAFMKPESLVMAHQLRRREYVPGPCTHRPSHHGSCLHPKSPRQPARETGAEGMDSDWDEVVTR